MVVGKLQGREHDEPGDKGQLGGDHHLGQVDDKEDVGPPEPELGEGVARRGGGGKADDGGEHRYLDGIPVGQQEVVVLFGGIDVQHDLVVIPGGVFRQPADGDAHNVPLELKGGGHHPDEGDHHQKGEAQQQDGHHHLAR